MAGNRDGMLLTPKAAARRLAVHPGVAAHWFDLRPGDGRPARTPRAVLFRRLLGLGWDAGHLRRALQPDPRRASVVAYPGRPFDGLREVLPAADSFALGRLVQEAPAWAAVIDVRQSGRAAAVALLAVMGDDRPLVLLLDAGENGDLAARVEAYLPDPTADGVRAALRKLARQAALPRAKKATGKG